MQTQTSSEPDHREYRDGDALRARLTRTALVHHDPDGTSPPTEIPTSAIRGARLLGVSGSSHYCFVAVPENATGHGIPFADHAAAQALVTDLRERAWLSLAPGAVGGSAPPPLSEGLLAERVAQHHALLHEAGRHDAEADAYADELAHVLAEASKTPKAAPLAFYTAAGSLPDHEAESRRLADAEEEGRVRASLLRGEAAGILEDLAARGVPTGPWISLNDRAVRLRPAPGQKPAKKPLPLVLDDVLLRAVEESPATADLHDIQALSDELAHRASLNPASRAARVLWLHGTEALATAAAAASDGAAALVPRQVPKAALPLIALIVLALLYLPYRLLVAPPLDLPPGTMNAAALAAVLLVGQGLLTGALFLRAHRERSPRDPDSLEGALEGDGQEPSRRSPR